MHPSFRFHAIFEEELLHRHIVFITEIMTSGTLKQYTQKAKRVKRKVRRGLLTEGEEEDAEGGGGGEAGGVWGRDGWDEGEVMGTGGGKAMRRGGGDGREG